MMIAEGFIAMIWAAAAMVIYNEGMADAGSTNPIAVVGIVSRSFLGDYGGIVAVLGVIVLAITSGDTALRSLRLMIGDYLHIDPTDRFKQAIIVVTIFVPLTVALIFAKLDAHGFNILWRYFSFANETCAVFAFSLITVYLYEKKKAWIIAFVPGCFYAFVVSSYLLAAPIGFNLSWPIAYTAGGVLTVVYAVLVLRAAHLRRAQSILT